jgi:NAD+-dependent farnesol dehydrogenase
VRVLVTGGTGYLGGAIVRALTRRDDDVVVFSRHAPAPSGDARANRVTYVAGDIRDRGAIDRAARGVDAIVHLAALVSVWRPRAADFDDVNVGGLRHVIEVCRAQRIRRLIYTSSFLALPPAGRDEPIRANDYQRTKVDARNVARAAAADGAPIVALYPGVIYGPGAATEGNLVGRLVRDHLAGRLPGIIGADRVWCFSFIDDVVAAHLRALTDPADGEEIAIGGENAPQIRVFEILRERRGLALPRRIPSVVAYAAGALDEVRARLTGRSPRLTRGVVTIFSHDWPLDTVRSTALLGSQPTSLADGMRTIVGSDAPDGGQTGAGAGSDPGGTPA